MDLLPRYSKSKKTTFPHIVNSFSKWLSKLDKQPDADRTVSLLLFGAAVLEHAGDPVVGQTLDGTIVTWNKGAEDYFGYTAQEMIGQSIVTLLPRGYEKEYTQIIEGIKRGEQIVSLETKHRCKDGRLLNIALTASPVRDPEGNLLGISSIAHETVQQKQIQDQLQSIARFLSENPNPILRVSHDGVLSYGNEASNLIRSAWDCQIGDTVPQPWLDIVFSVAQAGLIHERNMDCDGCIYLLQFVPIADNDYVNIYGRDITRQKQTEEVLGQSEERLRASFNNAALGIVEVDITGRFITVNNWICQILGYTRDELLQMTLHDLTAPEDRALSADLNAKLNRGELEFLDYEKRYLKRDGTSVWAHVTVSTVRALDGSFQRAVATIEDISDRRQAERTIRAQADLLEQVHDAILIWEWDNHVMQWYHGATRLYGWSREEAIGQNVHDLLQSAFPVSLEVILQSMRSEGEWNGELHQVTKNGREIIVESHMRLVRFGDQQLIMEINRDITERKWIEQIARQSHDIVVEQRQRLKAILAALPVGVVMADQDGRFIEVNEQAEQIWGPVPDITKMAEYNNYKGWWADSGKPVPPDEWPLTRALQKGEVSSAEAIDLERPDGKRVPVLVSAAPVRNEKGLITGGVGVIADITERRQIEDQLRYQATLLENVSDAIFSTDLNYKVISWNKAAENMYGWTLNELLEFDTDLGKIFKTEYPNNLTAHEVRQQLLKHGRWQGEIRRTSKSGVRVEVQVSAQLLLDANGEPVGVVSVERDITERKAAEDALKESEKRFRQLADSMPQLVWTARPDGTVDYYNQRHQEFKGIKPSTDGGWEWSPVLYPDDIEPTTAAWSHAVQTGEMYQIEHRICRADGSPRWYLSRGVPVRDDEGRIIRWYGTATDIHEQKIAEERTAFLQGLTADLSRAATVEEIAAVVANKAIKAVGGHLGSVAIVSNDGRAIELVNTYGISHEINRRFQHTPLDFRSPLTDAIRLGEPIWIETQEEYVTRYPALAAIVINTTDSQATACLPLIVDDQAIGGIGISFPHPFPFTQGDHDLLLALARQSAQAIQRARLYEVVLQERNKLWTLLDSMTEQVWFYNPEGKIALMNQAALVGLGLDLPLFQPMTERMGQLELDGRTADYAPDVDNSLFGRSLRRGETLKGVEMTTLHPQTGESHFLQTSAAPIKNEVGDIIGAVVVARDITDQKRAEEQTRALVAERERMRALTEFVQNVSHDFKTPLSILKTSLYLLDKLPDAERRQRQIAVMEDQTERLTELLEGMLNMTRLDQDFALNLYTVDLNHLVKEIYYSKLSSAEGKRLMAQLHLSEEVLAVQADVMELEDALLNLLDNAIQFTAEGGSVTLRTSREEALAVVEVLDTGIGIDETDLPHIFERLYRTDKARGTETGGIGLGLSIAQKIVQLHGGDIEVSSVPGKGTTFRVVLPLSNS